MQCSTSSSMSYNAKIIYPITPPDVYPSQSAMSVDQPHDDPFDCTSETQRQNNPFPEISMPLEGTAHSWRSDSSHVPPSTTPGPTKPTSRHHDSAIAKHVRSHESVLKWTNTNYSILSQLVNSLSLSQSDTDRLLQGVHLYYFIMWNHIHYFSSQIRCIKSDLSMPTTCHQLKVEEDRVLSDSKMRILDMNEIPQPVSTQGVLMIAPNQKISCMTYDLWDTIQDLMNDGDHAANAQFTYKAVIHGDVADEVVGEMWTADWWKEQQAAVGPYEKILALIIYVDETNVTFNGRNVHPVYISLGNLHVDFR